MNLWLSAEIQHEVSEDHRQIANQIEPTINSFRKAGYWPVRT